MESTGLLACFTLLLAVTFTHSSPLFETSQVAASLSTNNRHSSKLTQSKCTPVQVAKCSTFYNSVQMPNVFGENSQTKASETLRDVLSKLGSTNKLVTSFLCSVLIPPCPSGSKFKVNSKKVPLPCRATCEEALRQSRGSLAAELPWAAWPVRCHALPSNNCFAFDDISGLHYVTSARPGIDKSRRQQRGQEVASFAPLEVELGQDEDLPMDADGETGGDDDDDEFKIEVVSLTSSQTPNRLFKIADLGDPGLFHGWVDVQGTGVTNDYCRVVGKAKRKFLSCQLADRGGEGHHYVSKLGFTLGQPGTWFMRDMDGDGRDDYCRCVGNLSKSQVTCMKAGERGFFGSPFQGGSEHTFTLPGSGHCVDRQLSQLPR